MINIVILSLAISAVFLMNTAFAQPTQADYLKQSQVAMAAGRVYVALDLLQQAEQHSNSPMESWLISIAVADALLRNGQMQEAESKLKIVYQELKSTDNPAILSEIMLRFGRISAARFQTQKAKDWTQKALKSAQQRNDHAQIAVALLDLSKVSTDGSLLAQAAVQIQQLNDPELQQQLFISLGHQATQQGQIQIAQQALQSVIDKPLNTRLKSQAEGQMGELYAQQKRLDEALQLTEQAILSDSSPDLQLQWNWQRAGLLAASNKIDKALLAYRSAADQLQRLRIDIPVVYHNGKSSFNQIFAPLYTDFIAVLLKQAEQANAVQKQQLLTEAVQTWEHLKAVELQDYFRNACAVNQQQENIALEPGTAMLYPMLLSDHVALVVRFADQIKAYSVPQHPREIATLVMEVTNAIKIKRLQVERSVNLAFSTNDPILKKLQTLYQWLITPIAADLRLQKIQTLVYLPDAELRKIPFALLHDGRKYLTEQYALVTVPGLSMLAERSAEINKNDILLAGMSAAGPVVEEYITTLQSRGLNSECSNRTSCIRSMEQKLALPGVSKELKTLSSISNVPVMENSDFLLEKFKQSVHQGYSIVHIASHGFFSGNPEQSYIMTYDHLLNMQQLTELFQTEAFHSRPIELVTLSACQTAEGDDRSPLGLSGVVVQTGVKSAIGTLWPVDDDAAQQFFSDFYKCYQKPGVTKAQAMQQAQQKLLENTQMKHPFFWAPFVLVGEWH